MFRNTVKTGATVLASLLVMLASANLPTEAKGRFAENHPRRAEVNHRDNNLNNRLNANRGNLGGHYNQLRHEDQSIRRQQRRDARANGGYITKGEQHKLNREENGVNRQIRRDK